MKTLKICRTLCIISVIICLLIRWMPISYNTIPKVCIAAFLAVALLVNGKYSSNSKWHPSILSKFWGAKGFLIGQIVQFHIDCLNIIGGSWNWDGSER